MNAYTDYVETLPRYADLFAATKIAMQHGGEVQLSDDGEWWLVVPAKPDYDGLIDPCPFLEDAPVAVEVEGAAR